MLLYAREKVKYYVNLWWGKKPPTELETIASLCKEVTPVTIRNYSPVDSGATFNDWRHENAGRLLDDLDAIISALKDIRTLALPESQTVTQTLDHWMCDTKGRYYNPVLFFNEVLAQMQVITEQFKKINEMPEHSAKVPYYQARSHATFLDVIDLLKILLKE